MFWFSDFDEILMAWWFCNCRFKLSRFAKWQRRMSWIGTDKIFATTRRQVDKRAPFPLQQFAPEQQTRWTIPHIHSP